MQFISTVSKRTIIARFDEGEDLLMSLQKLAERCLEAIYWKERLHTRLLRSICRNVMQRLFEPLIHKPNFGR